MGFTDHCDLYGAVNEDGVNRVITHIMRQRPSLFNYASKDIAGNRKLWCSPVSYTVDVTKHSNPIFTVEPGLPILGADAPPVTIGFCAQLTRAEVDFHPGNVIAVPAGLNPPLPEQHFALALRLCGAIECPSTELVEHVPVGGEHQVSDTAVKNQPVFLPGRPLCFCLDVVAIGHVERTVVAGQESLLAILDAMEIEDLAPKGLEENLVCYLKTTVNVILREKLTVALETLMFSFPLFNLGTVTLAATADPPIPHNPAVEDDQVKAFITMTVI